MNLLQMAEKVLEEEKRALTAHEIWRVAINKKYDNFSWMDLNELLDVNVRKSSSNFFALDGSPLDNYKKYMLKSQLDKIRPGNKVRIPEHVPLIIDLEFGAANLAATKGSVGTILSYEEYSAHILKVGVYNVHQHHLTWVKSGMETRIRFPIRLEEVAPLSDDDYAKLKRDIDHLEISCRVGAIQILPTESFVVI